MVMHITTVHSLEGGIGKTTHALNLARAAQLIGKKAVLVELGIVSPKLYRNFNEVNECASIFVGQSGMVRGQLSSVPLKIGTREFKGIHVIPQSIYLREIDGVASMLFRDGGFDVYNLRLAHLLNALEKAGYEEVILDNDAGLHYQPAATLIAISKHNRRLTGTHQVSVIVVASAETSERVVYELFAHEDFLPSTVSVLVRGPTDGIVDTILEGPLWRSSPARHSFREIIESRFVFEHLPEL